MNFGTATTAEAFCHPLELPSAARLLIHPNGCWIQTQHWRGTAVSRSVNPAISRKRQEMALIDCGNTAKRLKTGQVQNDDEAQWDNLHNVTSVSPQLAYPERTRTQALGITLNGGIKFSRIAGKQFSVKLSC